MTNNVVSPFCLVSNLHNQALYIPTIPVVHAEAVEWVYRQSLSSASLSMKNDVEKIESADDHFEWFL